MGTIIQVGTTKYDEDLIVIQKTMSHLQTLCEVDRGYMLGAPVFRFGWTFFDLALNSNFLFGIEKKFADMIKKAKGKKPNEKFTNFMSAFFESRGCKVRLKLIES